MAKKKNPTKLLTVNTVLAIVLGSMLLAYPLGYYMGNNAGTTAEHGHADDSDTMSQIHSHGQFEVPADTAPAISGLAVTKDPKLGWNLSFTTDKFIFTPENAGKEHIPGQGHAHLYIDGKKITRLYSNNYYLGELSEGQHTITVTLNTNDHKDYVINGVQVATEASIIDDHHSEDPSQMQKTN